MADGPEKWNPSTRETADHSLPYCLAVVLLYGEINDDYFDSRYLDNPSIQEMMQKVSIQTDPECTALFPEKRLSRLEVTLYSGQSYRAELAYHKGHPTNPMSDGEIAEKFISQAQIYLDSDRSNAVIDRLWNLESETDVTTLISSLTKI